MATYTRAELRNAVLFDLGVLDARTAPSAEDAVLANDRIQMALEGLYEEGLIPFDLDSDAIPARYFIPLARVSASSLAPAFGKDVAQFESLAKLGRRELHRLKAQPYFGATAQATYY